ncbi:sensor histidine kinase [Massilia sp. DWR3-1-1]|uniref:sensor histidine kinase n=1 Tax=Massilia sp. DWR3-1-1 TaxID=2804559 RepID=UPI003CE95E57
MDLRRQLLTRLGACLLVLMLVTVAINLSSLRGDAAQEVRASERLALALLEAGRAGEGEGEREAASRLAAIIDGAALRHIRISVDGAAGVAPAGLGARLADLLGLTAGDGQVVRLGGQMLRIAPNPASEIDERLGDVVRLWSTLLFFSGATLALAWWAADRALAPVRSLEAGLQRLADGEPDAALPPFSLREFARVAAAIDRLAAALAEAQQGQRRLAHQLIRVQEDERRTLAMELHDEMGQSLTAISVTAAYLGRHGAALDGARVKECAADLRRDVRACSEQLRAMLSRLRPHGLEGTGLLPALRELLGSWQQRDCGIAFTASLPPDLPPLDKELGLVLYRVVQEGLTNVVRHSGARHCQLSVTLAGGVLTAALVDDGCGLGDGAAHGCGLIGMAERLRMVGGQLRLASGGAGGVRLQACLPLAALREAA